MFLFTTDDVSQDFIEALKAAMANGTLDKMSNALTRMSALQVRYHSEKVVFGADRYPDTFSFNVIRRDGTVAIHGGFTKGPDNEWSINT